MKNIALSLMLLCLVSLIFAQSSNVVTAQNQSPATYSFGDDVSFRIEINMGLRTIRSVQLRYKAADEPLYHTLTLKAQAPGSAIYEVILKSNLIMDKDIHYYFEFALLDGSMEVFPKELEINGPFELTAGGMQGKQESGFVLLSQDGEIESSDAFVFAVSFFEIADEIDLGSIRVWVGGEDVTRKSTITENTVVYRDTKTQGKKVRAQIVAKMDKEKVQSEMWTLKTPKIRSAFPIRFAGNVNFATNIYDHDFSSNLAGAYDAKNDWTAWGDASASYGSLTTYTNLLVSSFEDDKSQRVNRYTLGFKLPFFEVAAGDYSPTISNFVLNNRNQYGLYGKLFANQLGLEAVAGEIVRSTSLPDTDENGNVVIAPGGTFRQEVVGGRLRLGYENGFSLGINGARNRDIISSLPRTQYTDDSDPNNLTHSLTPQDNLVLSVDFKLNIPDQQVLLGAEVAGSLLNTNTLDPVISPEDISQIASGLDFINPENFADYFVINRNLEPFMPSKENLAIYGFFRTYFWNNLFNISYNYTGSAFNSLSTHSHPKDTSMINVSDQFFIGRFFSLNGGYSRIENNASKTNVETQKSESWFAQALLRIPYLPYFKGSYFNSDITNQKNPELQHPNFTPFKRNSNSISVGLGYDFKKVPILPSQLDVTYRMGTDTSLEGESEALIYENFGNSLNVSMTNRMIYLPLNTQFVFSMANQKKELGLSSDPDISNDNYTWYFKAEYALFNNRLVPYGSYRRVSLAGDSASQSFDYLSFGLEASPIQNMSINTGINKKYERFNNDPSFKNDIFTWNFLISQRF